MRKLLRPVLATVLLALLALSVLLANLLQMVSLVALPFSARAFRAFNRFICNSWFGLLRWSLEDAIGIEFRQTGEVYPWRENGFLIANHQKMADIPGLIAIARRSGRMGDLKWFVKDELKWVPGIGWGMRFLDCLFVKRNWTADKEKVTATFAKIREEKIPFWVVSFLEGTRATPSKIARSQGFAAKQGLPKLENLMLPRTKGFEATLEGLGATNKAVYDATIGYEGPPPSLLQLFYAVERVHIHTRRFTEWPSAKEEKEAWIIQRYVEKDAILKEFKARGAFPPAAYKGNS
jgi:1-acyl-sn-glycerol-3-phosphate acyltransferase